MKRLLLIFIFFLTACSQKVKSPQPVISAVSATELASLFEGCSMMDASIEEFWILLCQKQPHPQRPELYEYSLLYKTFKRLTFQDGMITDFSVLGVEDIVYSSTYDESKEQFLEISKGLKPGTDLYLRKRTITDFNRLTKDTGSDSSLFWSRELQALLFVHSDNKTSEIRQLAAKDKKVKALSKPTANIIYSPVTMSETQLYWLEWSESQKKSFFMAKEDKKSSGVPLFRSATKMLFMRPGLKSNELWIAFATGLGTELWSYNLQDKCLTSILKTQKKWSRFYRYNSESIELSVESGSGVQLQKASLPPASTECLSTLTGLGVEKI